MTPFCDSVWFCDFLLHRWEMECKHFQALAVVAVFEKQLDQRFLIPVSGHQTGSVTPPWWENKTRQGVKEEQTMNFVSAFLSILQTRTWQLENEPRNWVSVLVEHYSPSSQVCPLSPSVFRDNTDSVKLVHGLGLINWLQTTLHNYCNKQHHCLAQTWLVCVPLYKPARKATSLGGQRCFVRV